MAMDEVRRPVDRIDVEGEVSLAARPSLLLADDGDPEDTETLAQQLLALAIEMGHEIDGALVLHVGRLDLTPAARRPSRRLLRRRAHDGEDRLELLDRGLTRHARTL